MTTNGERGFLAPANRLRLLAIAGGVVLSLVVYALLIERAGFVAGAGVLVPAVLGAQFFGMRRGLLVAVVAIVVLNIASVIADRFEPAHTAAGAGMTLLLTVIVGRLEDLRRRVERAEAERLVAESRARMLASERLATLGSVAAGIAHEVTNPLSFVQGNLEFARDGLASGDQPAAELRAALEDALEGVRDTNAIIADVRALSRSGEDDEREAVDVAEVVRATVKLAQPQVYDTARLEVDLGETPPVSAIGSRLGQVVLNLIINATQSMPERPAEENLIDVSTRANGSGAVVIEVRDNGTGIPAAAADRIFDPFFTTKPVGVGTGLGLALSHSIVTSFGGRISFRPGPDGGTIFSVELPGESRAE
jgi:signal transduction histidine kinase